jgi:hypothetical protein
LRSHFFIMLIVCRCPTCISSPDLNPIEEAFSAIKAFLRRHEDHFKSEAQIAYLINMAASSITSDDAVGWFADCGYI